MNDLSKRSACAVCVAVMIFALVGSRSFSRTDSSGATSSASSEPQVPASSAAVASAASSDSDSVAEDTDAYNPLTGKPVVQTGNSSGNLANEGLAAEDKDWIYYVSYSSKDAGKLCKIRKDGTQQTVLCSDNARYLNVSGGWIYYSVDYKEKNSWFSKIYKIRTDGTARQTLASHAAYPSFLHLSGRYLYYENTPLDDVSYLSTFVSQIGLDGSQKTDFNLSGHSNFEVREDYIYELSENFNKVSLTEPKKEIVGPEAGAENAQVIYTDLAVYARPSIDPGELDYHRNVEKTDYSMGRYEGLFPLKDPLADATQFKINNVDYFNVYGESFFLFIQYGKLIFEDSDTRKQRILSGAEITNPNIIDGRWLYCTVKDHSYRYDISDVFANQDSIKGEQV